MERRNQNFYCKLFWKSKDFRQRSNVAEDSDDPFKELENDLTELRKIDPTLVPQDLTAQEIVDVDLNVITTDNPETDEEILESVRSDKDEETNGDDSLEIMEVFDEPIDKPTRTEIGNALETLQNLCLFNKSGDDVRLLLQRFETLVLKDELAVRKQSSIFNFFEKKIMYTFQHIFTMISKNMTVQINLLFSLSRSTSKRCLVPAG